MEVWTCCSLLGGKIQDCIWLQPEWRNPCSLSDRNTGGWDEWFLLLFLWFFLCLIFFISLRLVGVADRCPALRAFADFAQSDLAGFACLGQNRSNPEWRLSPRLRPISPKRELQRLLRFSRPEFETFFMLTVLASLSTSRVCVHGVPGAWAAFDVWTLYQSPSVSVLSVKGFDSAKSLNLHVCLTWCIAATTVWRCLRKQKYLIYLV